MVSVQLLNQLRDKEFHLASVESNCSMKMLNLTYILMAVSFIESNGVIKTDHPPYSPDLPLCDYWFFDYIKQHFGEENYANSLLRSIT